MFFVHVCCVISIKYDDNAVHLFTHSVDSTALLICGRLYKHYINHNETLFTLTFRPLSDHITAVARTARRIEQLLF